MDKILKLFFFFFLDHHHLCMDMRSTLILNNFLKIVKKLIIFF